MRGGFYYFQRIYIMKSPKEFFPTLNPWATLFTHHPIFGHFSQTQNLVKI